MAFESLLENLEREWRLRGWSPESLRAFRMEDPDPNNPPDPNDPPDPDEDEDDDDGNDVPVLENGVVKISQKAMTALMQRERGKGKRTATREFLKKYGLKDEKELEAVIANSKKRESDNQTEAERLKAEAEASKSEAEQAKLEAKKERFETRLERLLTKNKIKENKIAKAVKLLDLDDYDMDDEDLLDEVKEFMTENPEWFGESEDPEEGKRKPRTPGTKVPGQPRKPGEPTAADRAKDRLAKRHPSHIKSS